MGIFKIDYEKKPDDQFDYWRFWVDLNGEPIYAKRRKNSIRPYQGHYEMAVDILNKNKKMYALLNELCKESEYRKFISNARNFLVFYGYVLVDADDGFDNHIIFDSETTPREVLDQMKQDKTYNSFTEYDFKEEMKGYSKEECESLAKLHKIILEERSKIERCKKTTYYEDKDDDER